MAKIPEINLTDNVAENIVKMAPYLDEKSQHIVFGMMLEAVRSLEDTEARKAGQEVAEMSKVGIVYAKEVPMIKVKQVKEINGKGTPLHTVIQYWTKDGILGAEGKVKQCDEPAMKDAAS